MSDTLEHVCFKGERYYLRALGHLPRQEVARLDVDYPALCQDLTVPKLFAPEKTFSSVLRVSSSHVQLWTHYDVKTFLQPT
ncbi:unnamed protein product [Soboliphyme baturini]|uniref:Tudor domain-containing protein n=1 Tax=Soboliphyme baturini TaxID=241478 RepID=A0A183J2P7_9BILA|nr:unnamed protein product [Soboliphyme baturini]